MHSGTGKVFVHSGTGGGLCTVALCAVALGLPGGTDVGVADAVPSEHDSRRRPTNQSGGARVNFSTRGRAFLQGWGECTVAQGKVLCTVAQEGLVWRGYKEGQMVRSPNARMLKPW